VPERPLVAEHVDEQVGETARNAEQPLVARMRASSRSSASVSANRCRKDRDPSSLDVRFVSVTIAVRHDAARS
jgi:hypothetical protein